VSPQRKKKPPAVARPAGASSGDGDALAGDERPWGRVPAPLIAAAVAFLVYAPSLAGGFFYDDGQVVVTNASIRDLAALRDILLYEPSRPLLNLTWALNYAAGGLEPWPYHLVNVLIHCGNAALLASLFFWMARRFEMSNPRATALLGACLYAANPMAAETVAYVASRSSALCALFAYGCLRVTAGVLSGGSRSRLVASIVLFLLALATKEEAAALPFLLLLLDYFFVAEQKLSVLKQRMWIHAGFLAALPLGLLARRVVTGSWLPAPAIPTELYLLTQWAAFPLYLLRAILPFDPAFYRYHLPAPWPPDAITMGFCLLTLALVVLLVRRRREWPEWAFAVACLAAGLLPSSSLVALQEMVVDHRAYLGSFGIAFALGVLLWRVGGARLGILVVVLFAARSVHYEWVLGDPVRAWEDAVRRAPTSPDALCALAESYAARQDPRAEALFKQAVALNPGHYRYWANLGLYYGERGRPQEAADNLRAAADRAPREASVRDYLGQVLVSLGRDDEATAEFEAAIAAEPRVAQSYVNLALLSLRKGQPERARTLLNQAAPLASSSEEAEQIAALRGQLP
jgi:protein O-mannosyl-transferase